jgi:sec-independent protein translocase protein TatA
MINTILPLAISLFPEGLIIGLAILLFFGGKKIPELMKGIGGGIKEFKKASKEDDSEEEKTK